MLAWPLTGNNVGDRFAVAFSSFRGLETRSAELAAAENERTHGR
jgi:hypothetical protein